MNTLRTTILLAVLTALLIWIGDMLGGRQGAIIALLLAGGMNFFSYWFSDKIVIKMYGGQEVSAQDDPELYGLVQDLTQRAGLPMPKVYVLPQDTPNAFATGRNPGARGRRGHRRNPPDPQQKRACRGSWIMNSPT